MSGTAVSNPRPDSPTAPVPGSIRMISTGVDRNTEIALLSLKARPVRREMTKLMLAAST